MRFKVNDKYIVDAKSHDDAIRAIKMLDAMETYSIRWIDTYAKSQGYGPDFWRYDAEIKANNVKEALEKLAKKVALAGTGTANCLVMHVSNSHATYQFSGRLSELLKKTKEQLGDSVKDRTVMGFGKFQYEYWLKNNDGKWFLAAFSKTKYTQSEIEALRKKNKLKNGKLPDYQEKIDDSVKDGKYVSELKPGDVITKKDGSKWNVVLVRHTHFGIQVRMNSETSPVKTEEITYRPTDMLAYDSCKDAEPDVDVDLDFLIKDEIEAIDGYRKMIAKTSNPQLLSVLSHILDEETEHVEELRAAQAGAYKVEDSVRDALVAKLYISALGDPNFRRVRLLYNGKEVALLTQNEARALAAKISELANSATNTELNLKGKK